jgi:mannose-6-phosphate isomerase-like protein (cupin superfamily)
MPDFPAFLKNPSNRIAAASQYTSDIEGYVFDGADGSQVAFWTARHDRVSEPHAHEFDEYLFVIEGSCGVHIEGRRTELRAGDELFVPKGTLQSMDVTAGTRTVHVFGGKRARREGET